MSPRPGPRRPLVAVRLSAAGLEVLDDMAQREGVTRSEMIRTLLAEAVQARQTKATKPVRRAVGAGLDKLEAEGGEVSDEEVCGESYDHDLEVVDERDGIVSYQCRRCGAEVVVEPDGEVSR